MIKVLFLCVENSCRSQMAEGFFRHCAPANMQGVSAGSNPSGQVNPRAISLMAQRGIDLSSHASVGLEAFSEQVFDVAVTLGCGDVCPSSKAREHREWNLPDPKSMDDEAFAAVRDEIESKVQALIGELDGQNS